MTAANLRALPTFQNCNGNENSVRKRNCEENSIDDIAAVAMDFINSPGKGSSKKRVSQVEHGIPWKEPLKSKHSKEFSYLEMF